MKIYSLILSFLLSMSLTAQQTYTQYDEVPGNIKSYKPAYQNDYPEWAKMLYSESINFNEIKNKFEQWETENTGDFRPIRRYYKIWSQQIKPWVQKDGNVQLPDLDTYYSNLHKSQNDKTSSSPTRSSANWSFLGPKETFWLNESGSATPLPAAPWQVNIYSFDVSKTNPNVLFCGTETGYVNKTTDKGITWTQIGLDYNFGGGITATVIDPNNEDEVYVAGGNQVHKSTDGGETWSPLLNVGQQFRADRMEIDRSNSDKIYAAGNSGVYISEDGGVTWDRKYNQPAYDVHRHPELENVVYALSKTSNTFRLIVSEDGGETFAYDPNFPTNIADASGGLIAVTDANPNSIFVIMLSSNDAPLLYKGDYISGSWNQIATGNTNSFALDNGQGYFDLVMEVSNQNENVIYAGTSTLYKSLNGGATFTIVGGYGGNFPIHPDIQDMKILDDGEVWVSTDGGMNYSSDNFTSTANHVARINGIVGSDMWGFDQGWNEDIVVGGRYHNGNTTIADFYGDKALRMGGAESPTGWILKGKSRHVAFNDLGAGWIVPKTAEGQPEGRFLFSKYPTMDEYGGRRGNIVTHPNYFGTLILGEGNALWKSEDSGMSYTMIYDFGSHVRYIEMAYSDADVLFADIEGEGLMKSEDGGYSWVKKSSLTTPPNGNNSWGGRLFFAISPTDANTIYACLQNGTWSSDIGKVFKSVDGGDSWEGWTGQLSEYTKNLVVQPDAQGEDIVYLFTNARDKKARVLVRTHGSDDWEEFSEGFPAGFQVNLAMPFFRDNKIRVAGNSGVWESPLSEQDFQPIINPWVERQVYGCINDTVYFEDHSIINHEGCSWKWEITPEPMYMSDPTSRNPKAVLGAIGSYDVTMTITKNGVDYSKSIPEMISATSCPSIEDCNNPDQLPKEIWNLVSVDSEETIYPGLATMAFDDDPATIWHTRWTSGNDGYPHEMVVDMGDDYLANSFTYLPRQNGTNGRVNEYELYVSYDLMDWGEPISEGQFDNSFAPSTVLFDSPVQGRYFKLVCLSEVNGNIWASAAELAVNGCYANSLSSQDLTSAELKAFPIPSHDLVEVTLPSGAQFEYIIYDTNGRKVQDGSIDAVGKSTYVFDISDQLAGIYFIRMRAKSGVTYAVKVLKVN